MENHTKIYHLAQKYNPNLSKHYIKQRSLQRSLPSSILEELYSYEEIQQFNQNNIFDANREVRNRKLDLDHSKPYQYVGLNQMKSYQIKQQKKKKHQNSLIKRPTDASITYSRVSITKNQDPKILTKEQVIELFGIKKHSDNTSRKSSLRKHVPLQLNKKMLSKNFDNSQSLTLFKSVSQAQSPVNTLKKQKINGFSLNRLKSKIQHYQHVWNTQIKERSSLYQPKSCKEEGYKMQSLLMKSSNYRQIVQKKEKLAIKNEIQHIQPREWDNILRKDVTLENCHKKEIIHVFHDSDLISCGNNKLKKELQWIDYKDKNGYFFRSKRHNKQNLDSL